MLLCEGLFKRFLHSFGFGRVRTWPYLKLKLKALMHMKALIHRNDNNFCWVQARPYAQTFGPTSFSALNPFGPLSIRRIIHSDHHPFGWIFNRLIVHSALRPSTEWHLAVCGNQPIVCRTSFTIIIKNKQIYSIAAKSIKYESDLNKQFKKKSSNRQFG